MRRFVRLEKLSGLSGIILYNLPGSPGGLRDENRLDLDSVFGKEDLEDDGMDLDALLDAVQTRLIYFPVYACTSFAVSPPSAAPPFYLLIPSIHRSAKS